MDAAERVRDDLNERIVTLLSTLLRTTRDRAGVPTVILIDDAQFSPADPGLVALFERFLREAWLSSWPLLLLVTHWTREWHQQWDDEHTPTIAGAIRDVHVPRAPTWEPLRLDALDPAALRPVLHDALPGLTTDQATALLDRAGGHPLFLEEIIRTARQHPRHFRDRDPNQALSDEGLGAILAIGTRIVDFTHERLATAPPEVRELVCLSSLQGNRLLQRVNRRLARRLADTLNEAERVGDDQTLEAAERPYAFLQRTSPTVATFAQRIFYDVARDSAHDHFDVDDALTKLRDVLHEDFRQGPEAHGADEWPLLAETTGILLEESPEPEQRATAAEAFAALMAIAIRRPSLFDAERLGDRIVDGVNHDRWSWTNLGFDSTRAVALTLAASLRYADAIPVAQALVDLARSEDETAVAMEQLGDAWHGAGNFTAAKQARQRVLRIRRELVKAAPNSTTAMNLLVAYHSLGHLELEEGNAETAIAHFRKGIAIAVLYRLEDGRSLATSVQSMGDASLALDRPSDAMQHFQSALEIYKRRFRSVGTPESERDLGVALLRVADALKATNYFPAALSLYRDAHQVFEGRLGQLGLPSDEHDVGVCHLRIGDVLMAMDDFGEALEHYQEAHRVFRLLVARTGTPSIERNLSLAAVGMGDIHRRNGEHSDALVHYEAALGAQERLTAKVPVARIDQDFSLTLGRIGRVQMDRGNHAAACEANERSVRLLRKHCKPSSPHNCRLLVSALVAWSQALRTLGQLGPSISALNEAVGIDERLLPVPSTTQAVERASLLGYL
ncbi:MAG: tetratricopeptide repeat protein, partial [Thioalkalivibrio sp.]|nr:tetratricopeptide repeat protein [Thioalkalivibrio sp.]